MPGEEQASYRSILRDAIEALFTLRKEGALYGFFSDRINHAATVGPYGGAMVTASRQLPKPAFVFDSHTHTWSPL
jgi:hypothetical protein